MFYDTRFESNQPSLKLFIPQIKDLAEIEKSEGLNAVIVRGIIHERMDQIKNLGVGIIADSEILVEIRSNGVPTIELVDFKCCRFNIGDFK
jgi:hypothetical protein